MFQVLRLVSLRLCKYETIGGGFKDFFVFTPNLGEMMQFDEHIFQMGGSTSYEIRQAEDYLLYIDPWPENEFLRFPSGKCLETAAGVRPIKGWICFQQKVSQEKKF